MNILVTGGAGFLGSHICIQLLEQGHTVYCLDNYMTGSPQNLDSYASHPHLKLIEADTAEELDFDVDRIFCMASPASPRKYQKNPVQTMKTIIFGAINCLELARKTGARVLLASTSEIYGHPIDHPQNESNWGHVNPIGIRACYDEGKRSSETLFFDYNRLYDVDIRVIRIFNTYGPHMHIKDGRVVTNFVVQALSGEPLTLYGDGMQTRSFCFVSDLVRGILAVMDNDEHLGPFNLGNPQEISILKLAETIRDVLNPELEFTFLPMPQDDPPRRRPDITKAKSLLGWEPKVSLKEGLAHTIEYCRQQLALEKS